MPDQGEPSDRPGVEHVPPANYASPHEMRVEAGEQVRWYKPSPLEALRLMGWRVIWFLPAVLVIALICWIPLRPHYLQFLLASWKLLIPAIGLPLGFAIGAAKHAIRNRKEPFCIHCGYDLTGLPDGHRCPECGRPFSLRLIDEYRKDPHWFIDRYRNYRDLPDRDVPFEAGKVLRKKSRDGT